MPDPIPITPGRQNIVDIYSKALSRLKDVVAGEDFTLASRRFAARQIIEIQSHIKDLRKAQSAWAEKYIPESYKIGSLQDEAVLTRLLGNDYKGTMTALHREAAQVAAIGAAQDFDVVSSALEQTFVGYVRRAQVTGARRAVAQDIAGGIVEGAGRQTVSNRIIDSLKAQVNGGLITVGKTTMNAKAYADLLARTLSRAARTEGTLNRLTENGLDLVIFNNTGAVDYCKEYENQIFSISGNSKRFPKLVNRPPLHPNCYSGDTEIYTENGWVNIQNVKVGERCLSLNPETKEIEYVPVIMRHVTVPQEKMVQFTNRSFDLLVTSDHQMLYMTDWHYKNGRKVLKFKDAQDFMNLKSGAFYRSCEWQGIERKTALLGSKEIEFSDYVQFMAWYLSDGSTTESCNQVCISQSKEKSPVTYQEIHDLLHKIDFPHSHGEKGMVIQNHDLTEQLSQYGKSFEKYIPEEIKNASPDMIELFLDTYSKADGYSRQARKWKGGDFRDERVFFTASKRLADDLGELILKIGHRPSFRLEKSKGKTVHHKNGDYVGNYDIWVIRDCYSQYAMIKAVKIERVPYDDLTYCVELEKFHTLWVRRNGKTCWCGNCTHSISAWIEEFAPDGEAEDGSQFKAEDLNKTAAEMNKKYPVEKDDTRARTKNTQVAPVAAAPVKAAEPVPMVPEAAAWKPATTIEEAEKSLGSKVTIEEGIKNSQALDVANAISQERNRILTKYPELAKVEIKNINISRIQGASGLYNESTKTLSIRPESTSKAARNMAAKYSELKVKSTTCLDAEGIYRHELGHAVQNQIISEDMTIAIRNESFDYAESAIAKDISRYAVTDPDEAFAEMFSLMSSGQKTQFKTYQVAQKAIEGILK